MADGEIHQVEFDSPHGLVEFNSCIYIADTNNHAIRVVEINKKLKSEFQLFVFSLIQILVVY